MERPVIRVQAADKQRKRTIDEPACSGSMMGGSRGRRVGGVALRGGDHTALISPPKRSHTLTTHECTYAYAVGDESRGVCGSCAGCKHGGARDRRVAFKGGSHSARAGLLRYATLHNATRHLYDRRTTVPLGSRWSSEPRHSIAPL